MSSPRLYYVKHTMLDSRSLVRNMQVHFPLGNLRSQASDAVAQWPHVPQDSHECDPTQNSQLTYNVDFFLVALDYMILRFELCR